MMILFYFSFDFIYNLRYYIFDFFLEIRFFSKNCEVKYICFIVYEIMWLLEVFFYL